MRGPGVMPGHRGVPALRTQRERFDAVVLAAVEAVDARWHSLLGLVEYAVEDTPWVPDDWDDEGVPLATLVHGTGATPSRLVLFRRPIEHRCESRRELRALVMTVVVEQMAALLGMDPEDVDPRQG